MKAKQESSGSWGARPRLSPPRPLYQRMQQKVMRYSPLQCSASPLRVLLLQVQVQVMVMLVGLV